MREDTLREIFGDDNHEEFLKFENVPSARRLSNRPDIHAFILLDKLSPGKSDIVSSADHDQIWLGVDVEDIAEWADEEDILDLIRCGVMLDEDRDCFSMFV